MTFSGHLAVTALTLRLTHDPLVLVLANIVAHVATDAIPHVEWPQPNQLNPLSTSLVLADIAATAALAWGLYAKSGAAPATVTLAAIAGLLPDLTVPLAKRYWMAFHRTHQRIHTWPLWQDPTEGVTDWGRTVSGKTTNAVKVLSQLALVGIGLASLFFPL